MGLRVKRFPEYGVTLIVYSGALSLEALREQIERLDPDDLARCIYYGDPTVDLSAMDVASYPELRRIFHEKLRELPGTTRARSALVSDSENGALTLSFWPRYVGRDVGYPVEPVTFGSLEAACDWFGLPEAGRKAVVEDAKAFATPVGGDLRSRLAADEALRAREEPRGQGR